MRRTLIAVGFVAALVAPSSVAAAQTLVISQNKCGLSKIEDVRAFADSVFLPIAQRVVNEGKLLGFQSAFHAWGDEWNVVYVYQAKSISAFLSAVGEIFTEMFERYPDIMERTADWCWEHKDSFYSLGKGTVPPAAPAPAK